MSNLNQESVLSVHHWTDTLFSFTTTRDRSFRFGNGEFTMRRSNERKWQARHRLLTGKNRPCEIGPGAPESAFLSTSKMVHCGALRERDRFAVDPHFAFRIIDGQVMIEIL